MIERKKLHNIIDFLYDLREKAEQTAIPPQAKKHFKNAHKEQLLGVRACLDQMINRLDEKEKDSKRKAVQKIQIDE
ncbi:hypothetical protein [Thermoflavimicrobium daqui]|jgi:hypothetical protein|uniref:Uncharacterized protein n=1 Tax=Thermoflavimicrobium daqui TaxID=2137476 RepID=A0A364K898_9BACL|nr:hypothetical protein [Thermoflavimicrobium daqui]RAL26442.1 hypothetical protein DL897_05475 [Thermoflavimicrobium daqui]